MNFIRNFLKSNWLALAGFGIVWFFLQGYRAQVGEIAALKDKLGQLSVAVETLKSDAAGLRADIIDRTGVAIERKEKGDELEKTATAAKRLLDKGKEALPWARQPYPDYVYDAAKLLEQEN